MIKRSSQVIISLQKPSSIDELVNIEKANFAGSPLYQRPNEFEEILKNGLYLFAGAYIEGKLVAYCTGRGLEHYRSHVEKVSPDIVKATVFIESCECMAGFQKIGIGTRLFLAFVAAAKDWGFSHVAAHFRKGLSYNTAKRRLAGQLIDLPVGNYRGSGETYHFVFGKIG